VLAVGSSEHPRYSDRWTWWNNWQGRPDVLIEKNLLTTNAIWTAPVSVTKEVYS
jgi:hypothetical protein